MIGVLTLVGLFSGGSLALVYKTASPAIERHRLEELKKAIFLVLPGAVAYKEDPREQKILYEGFDRDNNSVGFAFKCSGNGFQGKIEMMVGVDHSLETLTGMVVLYQIETPGLGNKIAFDDFQDQFKGLSAIPEIEYIKNVKPQKPNQIQAITAATISSVAVIKIINRSLSEHKTVYKNQIRTDNISG